MDNVTKMSNRSIIKLEPKHMSLLLSSLDNAPLKGYMSAKLVCTMYERLQEQLRKENVSEISFVLEKQSLEFVTAVINEGSYKGQFIELVFELKTRIKEATPYSEKEDSVLLDSSVESETTEGNNTENDEIVDEDEIE